MRSVHAIALVAALVACLAAAGCLGQHGAIVAPDEPQRPKLVVLAPVSFNQDVPKLLEPGVPIMREEIARYLEQWGCDLVVPDAEDFQDLWIASTRQVGSLYDEAGEFVPERRDEAVRRLIERLEARHPSLDALVLPYLAVREASISGKNARWDGARRRIQIDLKHDDVLDLSINRGRGEATSLHVLVYGRNGEKVLEHYGGLEPMVRIEDKGEIWVYGLQSNLFEDREVLRDGIGIAFRPYFGD